MAGKTTLRSKPTPTPINWGVIEKKPAPKTATNMRAMFESGNIPDIHPVEKTQVVVAQEDGAGEFENTPDFREGVVRESDQQDDGIGAGAGKTAPLMNYWLDPAEKFQINRNIQIAEDEGRTLENEPIVRTDVVRESDKDGSALPGEGMSRDLTNKWLNLQPTPYDKFKIELTTNDAGVYENNPDTREGVVRETDYNEELTPVIPEKFSKNMRANWYEMTKDRGYQQKTELIRFTPEREMTPPFSQTIAGGSKAQPMVNNVDANADANYSQPPAQNDSTVTSSAVFKLS